MKNALFSRTLRTIGLTAFLTTFVSAAVTPTAQAVFSVPGQSFMACSDLYFNDPDFMYGPSAEDALYQAATDELVEVMDAINAEVNTFAVELDSPIGYTPNKVNGVAVEIPPEIERIIQVEMSYPYSREKVRMLNEQYGQYATFGQQITLVYSPAQSRRIQEARREYNTRIAAALTPEEKKRQEQETRELSMSTFSSCPVSVGFIDMFGFYGSQTIEVGVRPDLDSRLREDTTGATFFR
jgi:hypothetical protein